MTAIQTEKAAATPISGRADGARRRPRRQVPAGPAVCQGPRGAHRSSPR